MRRRCSRPGICIAWSLMLGGRRGRWCWSVTPTSTARSMSAACSSGCAATEATVSFGWWRTTGRPITSTGSPSVNTATATSPMHSLAWTTQVGSSGPRPRGSPSMPWWPTGTPTTSTGRADPMIAGPNSTRRALNDRARALLKADGELTGEPLRGRRTAST